MFKRSCLHLASVCLSIALDSAMANGVAIVDATGTKNFSEIQPAVDAAVDGDVLLVAEGNYAEFTIDGKGLSIFAVPGAFVNVNGLVVIKNLTWQRVVISGLRIDAQFTAVTGGGPVEPLQLINNTGHVRIQSCNMIAHSNAGFYGPGDSGVHLDGNLNVVFQNCQIMGGAGEYEYYNGGNGGHGMTIINSNVALYDSTVQGGNGGGSSDIAGNGGDGVRANQSSFLFSSDTAMAGGSGGNITNFSCFIPPINGSGGSGLVLQNNAKASILDSLLVGGQAGTSQSPCAIQGGSGYPYYGPAGSIQFLPGESRWFSIDPVASDEYLVNLSVRGPAGDRVFLLYSTSAAFEFLPALRGVSTTVANDWTLQLAVPTPIGTIPGSGVLTTQVKLPLLPNSVPRRRYFMQGYTQDPAGHVTLGSPLHHLSLNATPPPDCNGNGIGDYVEVIQGGSIPLCP